MAKKINYTEPQDIDIDSIIINNYRKYINPIKVEETATTISKVGLLQAIMVRKSKKVKGKYDLVFGQTRLLAFKLLKLTTIPARITDATDAQLPLIQLIENIQREAVPVLDECERFSTLSGVMEIADIAAEIGMTPQYVYDRIHLKKLAQSVRLLLSDGHLSFSQALQFTKLKMAQQLELLERIRINVNYNDTVTEHRYIYKSVRDIKRIIEKDFVISLSSAVFDTACKKLIKNKPCTTCVFRSGANTQLFNDVLEDDKCFNPACFKDKTHNHLRAMEQEMIDAGKTVVRINTNLISDDSEFDNNNLDLKYMSELKIVPDNLQSTTETNTYGVVWVSHNQKLVAKVVKIYDDTETVQPTSGQVEKTVVDKKIDAKLINAKSRNNIKQNNAKKAFKNNLMAALGGKIGETIFTWIPLSLIKLSVYLRFGSMDIEDILMITSNQNWTNGAGKPVTEKDVSYYDDLKFIIQSNTDKFKEHDWPFLLALVSVVDIMNNKDLDLNSPETQIIYELYSELKIGSIADLKKEVETDFEIELTEIIINA